MWRKGSAMCVGLIGAMAFYFLAVCGPVHDANAVTQAGVTYIKKAGDCVSWSSGHSWYFRLASTNSYPFKVSTSNSMGRAVYGLAAATSGANCAGYFKTQSSLGKAVYAEASSASGTTYALYAKAASSTGYALYADGYIHATGPISSDDEVTTPGIQYSAPRTHYYSLPAQAFFPVDNTNYFNNLGAYSDAVTWLVAPVHLPQGAVVTNVKFFVRDYSAGLDIYVYLSRYDLTGNNWQGNMAQGVSASNTGLQTLEDTTIDNPIIDNTGYGYAIRVGDHWDGTNIRMNGVLITYTVSQAE